MPKYTHKYTKHKYPQKTKRSIIKRRWKLLFYTLLAIGGLIVLGYLITKAVQWTIVFLQAHWLVIILTLTLISISVTTFYIIRIVRKRKRENPILPAIKNALRIMDSTAHSYYNEDEATKELISVLKGMGLRATYQPQNSHLGQPDGLVNDTILECKLDLLSQAETDRLIGQLQRYCQTKMPICIALIGHTNSQLLARIQNEVNFRYSNQVQIVSLHNAHRGR